MNSKTESYDKMTAWGGVLAIGCAWGCVESLAGVWLRGGCSRFYCGSMLTGFSMLFFATSFGASRLRTPLLFLPVIAGALRIYAGLLMGKPIISGAIANPVFAFFLETLAFVGVIAFLSPQGKAPIARGAAIGGLSAAAAAIAFPIVGFATTIPACIMPGTSIPQSIYGLPAAMSIGAVFAPLGFALGAQLRKTWDNAGKLYERFALGTSAAIALACILIVTFLHVG